MGNDHSGFEVRGTAERENGRGTWHVVNSLKELSEEFAGGALKSMGVLRCSREATGLMCTKGSGPRNGLTERSIRSRCADGNKAQLKEERTSAECGGSLQSKGLSVTDGTDH